MSQVCEGDEVEIEVTLPYRNGKVRTRGVVATINPAAGNPLRIRLSDKQLAAPEYVYRKYDEILTHYGPAPERWAIDLPNPYDTEGAWVNYGYYVNKEDALKAARELFGADALGRINIITQLPEEGE